MFPNPKQTVLVSLLRQNIEVKLSTQSAPSQICMGKWPVPSGAIYFYQVVVVLFVLELFSNAGGSVGQGKLTPVHNERGGGGKND